jgi:glycosyltransferase involved in cell wall biosynthesis
MPGFLPEPHRYIGNFDIFALTSKSEQQPIAVMEAMAAGLPIVAPAVGDISEMVAEENRPFVSNDWTAVRLRDRLDALAKNADLRTRISEANRARAAALFDEKAMIASYAALYANIAGKPGALG